MVDRKLRPRRKVEIEIPIPSIAKYIPGSGPPLGEISLLPPHDSTAYIIDQYVLPTLKDTDKNTRRLLYYHVGFTDIPTKIFLPCNKVLDYVSPRALEDWEYRNMEINEQEKARVLEDRKRSKGPAKEVGRPPKNKTLAEEVVSPTVGATEDTIKLANAVAGPSLATPQKRKLGMMLKEYEGGESNMESDETALNRQFVGESDGTGLEDAGDTGYDDDEMGQDTDTVDQLPGVPFRAPVPGDASSRASSSAPSTAEPHPRSMPQTSSPTRTTKPTSKDDGTLPLASVISKPDLLHPTWAQMFGRQNAAQELDNRHKTPQKNGLSRSSSSSKQPVKPKTKPLPKQSGSAQESKVPAFSPLSSQPRRSSRPSTPRTTTPSMPGSATGSSSNRKAESTKKSKTKGKAKAQQPQDDSDDESFDEDVWVVKELLDDRYVREKGAKVHMYLVKWEGDWPPEQNPSWEPAENIRDENLIVEYRRRKKAGLLKPDKHQKSLLSYMSGARYSNVAEAFEGDVADRATPKPHTGIESDSDESDEELMVTEAPPPTEGAKTKGTGIKGIVTKGAETNGKQKIQPNFSSFDAKLAQFKHFFPGMR